MSLTTLTSMDQFLASVERRAFRIAYTASGNHEDALDIVQDSMIKLTSRYAHHDQAQWPPLFYRILNNRITDFHRSQQSRWKLFDRWFSNDEAADMDQFTSSDHHKPDENFATQHSIAEVEKAIRLLSPRQQQAFMFRCWEGLDTKQTAHAMGCTQGTVKTLYSRALNQLRENLGEDHGQ